MAPRKRKSSKTSPNIENKEAKRKMAANQSSQIPSQTCQSSQNGSYQNGQTFTLPHMQNMYAPISPYYMNAHVPPTSPNTSQNQQGTGNDLMECIVKRLEAMDAKLLQLNNIQASVSQINDRLGDMDRRVKKVEKSQEFICDQFDKLSKSTDENKKQMSSMDNVIQSVQRENKALREKTATLTEDIIDLKCRSMRDNLLFFGIAEAARPVPGNPSDPLNNGDNTSQPDLPRTEDCAEKVYDFRKNTLKIDDPKSKIYIDRAHRVGVFKGGKTRPVVAKFRDTNSKLQVQHALKSVNLRGTQYNVSEQYPQEVKERRKELIPVMIKARSENKKAVLVRDKLYINNRLYNPGATGPVTD